MKKESIKNKEPYHLNKTKRRNRHKIAVKMAFEKRKRNIEEYYKDNSLTLTEYQQALESASRCFTNNPSSAEIEEFKGWLEEQESLRRRKKYEKDNPTWEADNAIWAARVDAGQEEEFNRRWGIK